MLSAALDSDLVDEDSSRAGPGKTPQSFTKLRLQRLTKEKIQQIFDDMDDNCSGTINAKELKILITACCDGEEPTDDDVATALKEIDKDGNATIFFAEFLKWIEAEEYRPQRGAGETR